MNYDPTHLMEFPRKILIGPNVIQNLGPFLTALSNTFVNLAIVTGRNVKPRVHSLCQLSLTDYSFHDSWYVVNAATMDSVRSLEDSMTSNLPDAILGFGGGRSVDVAKMIAFDLGRPFISVPTSASHDGISSPFVSIRGIDKPFSIQANTPLAVLADTKVLSEAPKRLLSSGCGDLVAKVTAVKDWQLAREETNEYYGTYAANLAYMSAKIIIDKFSGEKYEDTQREIRTVIEALISAGVASCIAGSSRPCSGAEHLFSHAIEYVAGHGYGLHGERVGLGTIMMAKLHELDWESVIETLRNVGAPTTAKELGLNEQQVVSSLIMARSLRPDRYTILDKVKLDHTSALNLARSVSVI
jgi:glycerol-1-phosphate dehydrogenase [NAD(P)+]